MCASNIKKGHVNFGGNNGMPKENSIRIGQNNPGLVQVGLGFLQYQHIYKISADIPKSYFLGYDLKSVLSASKRSPLNINCKIVEINEKKDFYEFIIELFAVKERLAKEKLIFIWDDSVTLTLEFNARVLGPGKGTPLLKNGIKCIGTVGDELSDVSDWQGDEG